MLPRFTLAALTATILLTGCARHATENSAAADTSAAVADAPAQTADATEPNTAAGAPIDSNDSPSPFESGPTLVNVSHKITRTDDGSSVYLTVDGQNAGLLQKGENKEIRLPAGKHQIGGYVETLFGFGKVTIASVDITTDPNAPKNVVYAVTRQKPGFSETNEAPPKPNNS